MQQRPREVVAPAGRDDHVACVELARTPPNIVLRAAGGVPGDLAGVAMYTLPERVADAQARAMARLLIGDLGEIGLPAPEEGLFARLRRLGVGPAIVDAPVIDAIRARRIEIVAGVESLGPAGVRLADGSNIEPAAVIAATGYRGALEPIVGRLGVLGPRGAPSIAGGREAAPGLRFIGFVPAPGQIRLAGIEARAAAAAIARRLAAGARRPRARRSR